MMKVLHFYKTFYPATYGGVEQVIHQIAAGTLAHGVSPTVLSVQPRGAQGRFEAPYAVEYAPRDVQVASMDLSLAVIGKFRALAATADVIHYHYPWPYMDLLHFICGIKKPILVTYHADITRQKKLLALYRPLQKLFLSRVDKLVATSPAYAASSPVLQGYADKVAVVPIGVDRATYPQPTAAQLAPWQARLPQKFFLFVGALRQYKGLNYLLDALRGQEWPLVIVGDGPERAALEAQARQLGISAQVQFLGALDDVDKMALLTLCHAFVFPSHLRSEAFGVSLLEAAMVGKPMISTEIGTGTSYINLNGETGLTVPPRDPTALAEVMQKLWDDPALATQYGQQATQRYEALFTADKMAAGYAALYRELLR